MSDFSIENAFGSKLNKATEFVTIPGNIFNLHYLN